MSREIEIKKGCRLLPGRLDRSQQQALLGEVREALRLAPLFIPQMPRTGKPFSVRMSNMGLLGWVSDKERGYRYQPTHPDTGTPWPPIPPLLLELWREQVQPQAAPEACLINYYNPKARMGAHVDVDEAEKNVAILSISLGDTAKFRLGGLARRDPSISFELKSGDVLVLEPPLRLAYHGIDRILGGSSGLLEEGGRFNLTLRRVSLVAET